jgi:hypothetical protein
MHEDLVSCSSVILAHGIAACRAQPFATSTKVFYLMNVPQAKQAHHCFSDVLSCIDRLEMEHDVFKLMRKHVSPSTLLDLSESVHASVAAATAQLEEAGAFADDTFASLVDRVKAAIV